MFRPDPNPTMFENRIGSIHILKPRSRSDLILKTGANQNNWIRADPNAQP